MIRTCCMLVGTVVVMASSIGAQPPQIEESEMISSTPFKIRVVHAVYPFELTPEWGTTIRVREEVGHPSIPGFVLRPDRLDGVHLVRDPFVQGFNDTQRNVSALETSAGMFACERNGVVSLIGAVGCPEGFTGRFMMLNQGDMVHRPDEWSVVRRPVARVPISPGR
jgi:hypothetical protein